MTDILEQLIGMLRNEQRRDERCRDVLLREPLLVMLAQRDQARAQALADGREAEARLLSSEVAELESRVGLAST